MAKGQRPIGSDKSEVIRDIPLACQDEGSAVTFMERQRWGDSPACPHCASPNVYTMRAATGERMVTAIKQSVGKRLRYRDPA